MDSNGLMQFAGAVASGAVRVVDLTFTLSPDFPVIVLPPEFGQAAPVRIQRLRAVNRSSGSVRAGRRSRGPGRSSPGPYQRVSRSVNWRFDVLFCRGGQVQRSGLPGEGPFGR